MKHKRPHSSKPRTTTHKKSKISKIKYGLTPEEMYKLNSHQLEYGIEGYEIPRKYNDHHQCVWARKREKILSSHKHVWPPEDWPRSKDDENIKVKPKRKTFLDDLYKWCYSYYDKEKAEKLIEEKNININDYVKPRFIDKKKRTDFLENEKKKEEWRKSRPEYSEYMQGFVEDIQEKVKQEESEKVDPIEKIKKRYQQKPQTSRCDRVSVVSEAQYLGEQVPFYNTYVPEDGEIDKKKLFFPSKHYTWKRAPAWKYPKDIGPNVEFQREEKERLKEKIEEYMSDKDLKKEDLWINVVKSYHKVTHHGELPIKFQPIYKVLETEQYTAMLEKQPRVYIGPQQYWKMPKETYSRYKAKKPNLSSITDDNGNKIYYMDRKKTDKRVYSAGMRKSVY
jgi:hypothetical protein